MTGKKMNIRTKAILLVALFMLATNLALGAVLMRQSRIATKTQINERMLDIVNTAAAILDGDVLKSLTAEERDTPEYREVYATLQRFLDNINLLEMEGMESDHAENGRIAVDMFARSAAGTYDAVLMDIRMPEMDGLEAAAAIRAMDRPDAKRIPIIALTANAFDEDVQRSLQAGMNAHLSKPVDPDNLYRALGELIFEAENIE